MDLDPTRAEALDRTVVAYTDELRLAGEDNSAATLAYTHGIHRIWRQVMAMLPVPVNSTILDVGTGFGLLPFELAANMSVRVQGVDVEPEFVRHALILQRRLEDQGYFTGDSEVEITVGDAVAMECADASVDLAFVREVLQFIPDPVGALRELLRVLRPGAFACVGDTDDALRITWPPPSPPLARLIGAVSRVQHAHGGDRQMGRKLTTFLRAADFTINSLVVLPEAQHRQVDAQDVERSLVIEQLKAVRPLVLSDGAMTAEQFDGDLGQLEQADSFEEFRLSARIVVLAQRPTR